MTSSNTMRHKILFAALDLSAGSNTTFTLEQLVVCSWEKFPDAFGLKTYSDKYPDSNSVIAELAGPSGLVGTGWLERLDTGLYKVSRKGRIVAAAARTGNNQETAESNIVDVSAEKTMEIEEVPPAPQSVKRPRGRPRKLSLVPPIVEPKLDVIPPQEEPATKPSSPTGVFTSVDVLAIIELSNSDAYKKSLRGSPLTLQDARSFWNLPANTRDPRTNIRITESLIARACAEFNGTPSTDLPKIGVCYGLRNLHSILERKFAQELGVK